MNKNKNDFFKDILARMMKKDILLITISVINNLFRSFEEN